jgi:hypothetical protein
VPSSSGTDAPSISEPSGPARGPDGKFQKKSELAAVVEAVAQPSAPAAPQAPAATAPAAAGVSDGPRAPQSWKPQIREHWATLPTEVREEIIRRESQVQAALADSAEARDVVAQFLDTISPYEAFIRAENSDPFSAIRYMMDTAVALRTSPPQSKAQLVANIIKQYGVDIGMLDAALVGQAPAYDPNIQHFQQMLEKELAPIRNMMGQLGQVAGRRQHEVEARASSDVETFSAAPGHEFYEDVRETMADLLDVATRRGITMSLQDAYDKACAMDPSISKVVEARRLQSQAQQQQQRADQARRAGSSMPSGGPAPAGGAQPDTSSVRGAIEAAISGLAGA